MTKKYSEFADGSIIKVGDKVVGLRDGTNTSFNFPADGIKDADGNYLFKYQSAGAIAVNHAKLNSSLTGEPVIIEPEGSDSDIDLTIRSNSDGSLNLESMGAGDIHINTPAALIDMNSTTPIAGILDEDDMSSDSATHGVTQQSSKAYTDNQRTNQSQDFFNGVIIEFASVVFSSDGATASLSIEKDGGGDLTVMFSTGPYVLDTTPPIIVNLNSGTDEVPAINFVYLLESTKTIVVSSVGFPAVEYAGLSVALCQSAATSQADGCYRFTKWMDNTRGKFLNGHSKHVNFWIRFQHATWLDGVDLTPTVGVFDFSIATTLGRILQLHLYPYPVFDTSSGSHIYLPNDFTTPYDRRTDLTTILTDANGASMSDTRFNLVVWGCVNESTQDCQLFINLPTGSYNFDQAAMDDTQATSVYTIPFFFRGAGFLISRLTIRHELSTNTWSIINQQDLRGFTPNIVTEGGGGGLNTVEEDPSPILGGNLGVSAYEIQSSSPNDLILNAASGQSLQLNVNSGIIADLTATGLRLGSANSRVTTILDEDNMASDSATALATQQSIKAYVDGSGSTVSAYTYITKTDNTAFLPNSEPLDVKATGIMASTTATGEVETRILTGASNQIDISNGDGSATPTWTLSSTIVTPGTTTLGGTLYVTGQEIEATTGNVSIITDGSSSIDLSSPDVLISEDLAHAGNITNKIIFTTDAQDFQTTGSSRLDISSSGVRLGAANSRVTTILDEDNMASDSNTSLATQQSIKSYVDGSGAAISAYTYITKTDHSSFLPNSEPLSVKATGIMASTTATGEVETRVLTGTSNEINIANGDGSAAPTWALSSTLVFPGSATLGGTLFVDANNIEASSGNVTIVTDGASSIELSSPTVAISQDLAHGGNLSNKIVFGTDIQDFQISASSKLDMSASGVRLGGANSRVTTILDEDDMISDSNTSLATQQSIKSYVDNLFPWTEVTGLTQTIEVGNGYIANNAAGVMFTLPLTANVGDIFKISGKGVGKFRIGQNALQTIFQKDLNTTPGLGGGISAKKQYDALEIVCITDDIDFVIISLNGDFTFA